MKTVYCRDGNRQMQSKYSFSQSQGDVKSCSLTYKINKHKCRHTRGKTWNMIPLHISENLLFDHKPRSVFVAEPHNSKGYSFFGYTILAAYNVRVFLHSCRQRRWECFSSNATLTTRRTAESYTVLSDFDKYDVNKYSLKLSLSLRRPLSTTFCDVWGGITGLRIDSDKSTL